MLSYAPIEDYNVKRQQLWSVRTLSVTIDFNSVKLGKMITCPQEVMDRPCSIIHCAMVDLCVLNDLL